MWYGAVEGVTEEVGNMGNYVLWTTYKRVSLLKWSLIGLRSRLQLGCQPYLPTLKARWMEMKELSEGVSRHRSTRRR